MSSSSGPNYKLIFRDGAHDRDRKSICEEVLRQYHLPTASLVCIFDNQEREAFLRLPELGPNFCGLFSPVKQTGIGNGVWAPELIEHLWDGHKNEFAYDAVIYLRKRTCDAPTGMIITLAHELQHFMQYGHCYKVWRAQKAIQAVAGPLLKEPRPWHFPAEHEAQLLSKRVSERLLGAEEVRSYAEEQIGDHSDVEKWLFFLALESSTQFDFLQQTDEWVNRYRSSLLQRYPPPDSIGRKLNFSDAEWWK